VVGEMGECFRQAYLVPARVALRTKKSGALVVVYTVNGIPLFGKKEAHFRADEAR